MSPILSVVAENDDVVVAVLFLFMLPILSVVAENDDVVGLLFSYLCCLSYLLLLRMTM